MLTLALLLQLASPAAPPIDPAAPPIDWDAEFGVAPVAVDPDTGERPVNAYVVDNANAGARPVRSPSLAAEFGGRAGLHRIVDRLVASAETDPRIGPIFAATDNVRLRRTLFEQVCYLLAAGCDYTGRDMAATHKDLGLQVEDLNVLVSLLQDAMQAEDVPFGAQNRLLAKLVGMKHDVVTR